MTVALILFNRAIFILRSRGAGAINTNGAAINQDLGLMGEAVQEFSNVSCHVQSATSKLDLFSLGPKPLREGFPCKIDDHIYFYIRRDLVKIGNIAYRRRERRAFAISG